MGCFSCGEFQMKFIALCFSLIFFLSLVAPAEDWPEWRGQGRGGDWLESGILTEFPRDGLKFVWRTPIRSGFSGPAVSAGRVFVTDFSRESGLKGTERVLCLDEQTGRTLWTRSWLVDYGGMQESYAIGPRATPTVDGAR